MYAKPPTIYEFVSIIRGKETTVKDTSFIASGYGQWLQLMYPSFCRDPFNWVSKKHSGYHTKGLPKQVQLKLISPYLSGALQWGLEHDEVDFP